MGTSLSGLTPQNTYTGLLKFGDNSAISASLKYVSDGAGNDTLLAMSTTALNIGANNLSARLGIKGSGSTSATTSLLVQNSAGQNALEIKDDKTVGIRSDIQAVFSNSGQAGSNNGLRILVLGASGKTYMDGWSDGALKTANYPIVIGSRTNQNGSSITGSTNQENGTPVVCGSDVYDTSAQFQINSTTRGFLPPRMTTTQKNAIATPAAGLVVYDSTTNKLCCYNGSTWNDLF